MIRDLEFPVLGYHGTNLAAAKKILKDGFRPSTNNYDWLGRGVYFFQDAPDRAWDWAYRHTQRNYPNDSPAVIRSRLRLKNCIDLFDSLPDKGWPLEIRRLYNNLRERFGDRLPQQGKLRHELDRFVISYLIHILRKEKYRISAIRSVFLEGEPIFEDSALYNKGHAQIAIRDLTLIKESQLLSEGEN